MRCRIGANSDGVPQTKSPLMMTPVSLSLAVIQVRTLLPDTPSVFLEFAVGGKSAESQVYKPGTAQPSINCSLATEKRILEEFLDEMDPLDHLPTLKTDQMPKKKLRKRSVKPSSEAKVQTAKKPSPPWKRRKEELQGLRVEVKAMETQVAYLKLRHIHDKLLDACVVTSEGAILWKATAIRERQLCQQAQQKNSEMKSKI